MAFAVTSATSDGSADPGDEGFAFSKSAGCTTNGSCGASVGQASASNGTGSADTLSVANSVEGDTIVTGATAAAGTGAGGSSMGGGMTLTPNGWTHTANYQEGSSEADSSIDIEP